MYNVPLFSKVFKDNLYTPSGHSRQSNPQDKLITLTDLTAVFNKRFIKIYPIIYYWIKKESNRKKNSAVPPGFKERIQEVNSSTAKSMIHVQACSI